MAAQGAPGGPVAGERFGVNGACSAGFQAEADDQGKQQRGLISESVLDFWPGARTGREVFEESREPMGWLRPRAPGNCVGYGTGGVPFGCPFHQVLRFTCPRFHSPFWSALIHDGAGPRTTWGAYRTS